MSYTTVVTAPAHLPVTLDEVKAHLEIPLTNMDHDAALWLKLQAATEAAETETGRNLVTQTPDFTIDRFPPENFIWLPGGSLQSIASLTYTDSDDTPTVFAASNYDTDTVPEPGRLVLKYGKSWPTVTLKPTSGIVIRYTLGYGTGDLVPAEIRVGILMYIGNRNSWREATAIPEEKPTEAYDLWHKHKLYSFGSQPGVRL